MSHRLDCFFRAKSHVCIQWSNVPPQCKIQFVSNICALNDTTKLVLMQHQMTGSSNFKGPIPDLQSHPPTFFSKKVEIFTSIEAIRYIMSVYTILLVYSFVWRNKHRIDYLSDLCFDIHVIYTIHSGLCDSMIQ